MAAILRKTGRRITERFIVLLPLILLLSGCSAKTMGIDDELAGEIAVDAAGYRLNSVRSLSVTTDDSGFLVTFSVEEGSYLIGINDTGKVISFKFVKSDTDRNKEVEEASQTRPAAEEETDSETDLSLDNDEIIPIVAAHLGLTSYEAEDFSIEALDSDQARISVDVIGYGTAVVIMNTESMEILSTSFQ